MLWHMEILKIQQEDNVLRNKTFNIAKNPKYDRYQKGLASMIYKFFNKKSASGKGVVNNDIKQILQLAEELHKPIIITDLADMQLISKLNEI